MSLWFFTKYKISIEFHKSTQNHLYHGTKRIAQTQTLQAFTLKKECCFGFKTFNAGCFVCENDFSSSKYFDGTRPFGVRSRSDDKAEPSPDRCLLPISDSVHTVHTQVVRDRQAW